MDQLARDGEAIKIRFEHALTATWTIEPRRDHIAVPKVHHPVPGGPVRAARFILNYGHVFELQFAVNPEFELTAVPQVLLDGSKDDRAREFARSRFSRGHDVRDAIFLCHPDSFGAIVLECRTFR